MIIKNMVYGTLALFLVTKSHGDYQVAPVSIEQSSCMPLDSVVPKPQLPVSPKSALVAVYAVGFKKSNLFNKLQPTKCPVSPR